MDILSIGNSFSTDAHRYLHSIAKADDFELNTFNLFIGGCPLSLHYQNMLSEEKVYTLEMNGQDTGFKVSLKEALLNRKWDVVTLQQVSHESPYYETYQPYLNHIVKYVRECVSNAEIAIHQTWAYEKGCYRLNEELGYSNREDMFEDIKNSYNKAADEIKADYIIPSGEVFESIVSAGVEKVHRDTYHASLGLGRYALGLTWYATLTGNEIEKNAFFDFDEEISLKQTETVKKCVKEVCTKYLCRNNR